MSTNVLMLSVNHLTFCVKPVEPCLTLNVSDHQHNFKWGRSSKVHKQKHEYPFLIIKCVFFKCLGHICSSLLSVLPQPAEQIGDKEDESEDLREAVEASLDAM